LTCASRKWWRVCAESVRDGTVRVRYVPTDWNHVDIMTKTLSEAKFKTMREMCVSPRNQKGTMLRWIDEMVMLISDRYRM